MAYFPALVLTGYVNIEGSFLNLMGYQNLNMITVMISTIFHFGFCYFFVYQMDYGFEGIGYASSATAIMESSILISYSR